MYREILLTASVVALPGVSFAQDLGEAIAYIEQASDPALVGDWSERSQADEETALPMLASRDVHHDKTLDQYDCESGMIDGEYTLRTTGEMQWAVRRCREMRFRQDSLPEFRTMGPVPLYAREVERMAERAGRETEVPAALLMAIARHVSGFRAGAISNDGRVGLMQLQPDLLRGQGIQPGNLQDPQNNMRKGAEYVRQLTLRLGSIKMAMAAYLDGPDAVADAGGVPGDARTIWFVREMTRLYYASIREFPNEIGAESMAFVWNWMN